MMLRSRTFLIEAREAAHMTRNTLAQHAVISVGLVRFLEEDNLGVTHPNIADRIADILNLTIDQRNEMVNPKHHIKSGQKKQKKATVKRRLGDYSINRQTTEKVGQ